MANATTANSGIFPPLTHFKQDFMAGIVVFLVAIPLCLGIALASGAPLFSGIIAGIIGGIVVGMLSESAISVSGPAAGMVAVVIGGISTLGGFNEFLLALMFAGILQIVIGALRAGFIADYIPSNVIQGLLCAIGLLIILKQLPFAFTHVHENKEILPLLAQAVSNLRMEPLTLLYNHFNGGALLITAITIFILVFFDKTNHRVLKQIPGPIAVVVIAVLLNESFELLHSTLEQTTEELVNIPVSESIRGFLASFSTPSFTAWKDPNVYLYAVILAAVASLEALLNLEGVEKLDKNHHYCSRNRELVAQGVGNTLSGLIGGLPITSVIVRSSVNLQSGCRTKLSTVIHGLLILFIVALLPGVINMIPLAALAGILIYVGYKLSKPVIYKEMFSQGMTRFLPFILTVIAIVALDLLTGIILGLCISIFFILWENAKIKIDIINEIHPSGEIKRIILPEHLSFLRKAALVKELNDIPNGSRLIIDARHTKYIDRDISEVISVFKDSQAKEKNINLNMVGFKDHYELHDYIDFINVTTYDVQSALTPTSALEILKEGNKRFINDQRIHRDLFDEMQAVSGTQHPIAIVVGCIDSRVPIETIFDTGVGDVFVARVAGNVINEDIISSIEFACNVAGAKLVIVLGHTGCGAIKAACDLKEAHFLDNLLDKIRPAIEEEKTTTGDRTSDNQSFLDNVIKLNVEHSLKQIKSHSDIVTKMINDNDIELVGAVYDINSGEVRFQ